MRLSHVVAACLALVLAFGFAAGVLAAANSAPPAVLAEQPVVTPPAPPSSGAQPASPARRPTEGVPPFSNHTQGGAPAFASAGDQPSDGLMVSTLPLPGSVSLALCLDSDRVWGVKSAGQLVTMTVNGTQMGAAVADGKGFFWSPLYTPAGVRPSLATNDGVTLYPSGASAASVTLRGITGQINPVTNIVSGTITGAPISVTVYVAGSEPAPVSYSQTVSSNASGYFIADFTGVYDLFSTDSAMVAYVQNGIEVHRHVYPAKNFYVGQHWQEAGGYAAPGSVVTVTVYPSGSVTAKETITLTTGATDGWYYTTFGSNVQVSDIVEVTRADGVVLSRTVDALTEVVDAANDRVTGQAKPGATVVGLASRLTPLGWQDMRVSATATAGGLYTLTFGGLVDILPGYWIGVLVPDAAGNDLNIWQPAMRSMEVNQTWTSVGGRGAFAPPVAGDQPVTLTIRSAALGGERTFTQNLDKWDGYWFDQNLPRLAPGDLITVANGAWIGTMTVTTLTVSSDLALDRFTGSVVLPSAQVEVNPWQWNSNPYPLGGSAWLSVTATATGRYTATLAGFDLRNGSSYDINHRTAAAYVERISRDVDYVHVWMSWNGLNASLYPPGTAYTVTLATSSGTRKAQRIGLTNMPSGDIGWQEFFWNGGQRILIGDQLRVQGGNGFSQTVVIPSLVITPVMGMSGVIVGQGPANTRLYIEEGNQSNQRNQGYVSTDRTGHFAVAVNQLQSFNGNSELQAGDWVRATYFDQNNNRVSFDVQPPDLQIQKQNTNGNARPGGVYVYQFQYWNNGRGDAANTVITDTLPEDTTYAGDTSTFTHEIGAGGVITWHLGTLASNTQGNFMVTLNVDPGASSGPGNDLEPNCANISTATPGDTNTGNNSSCAGSVNVEPPGPDMIDVGVNKWVNPNDPARGEQFQYTLNGCNQRSTAAGPVWLTDTLPVSTTYVSWALQDTNNPMWKFVTQAGNQVVFMAPGLPGNSCAQVNLTLRLDPAAPLYSVLENTVDIATAGDSNAGNDRQVNTDARVSRPRNDVNVNKWTNGGQLVPGGFIEYGVGFWNQGNAAVRVRITDTLPAGATYQYGSAWSQGQQIAAPTVVGNQLVWDFGTLGVNENNNFNFRLDLGAVAPNTVITNSVKAGLGVADETPWDNSASVTETVRASGPNLRVQMSHDYWNWRNNHNLNYEINFQNLGDARVDSVWITDTRPAATSFQPWCQLNWNGNRIVDSIGLNGTDPARAWKFDYLDPGESGSFWCSINLDDPNANPRWYTNTVAIDTPAGDTNPADNQVTDTAVNGEIGRVELNVGTDRSNMWGSAQPNAWVTVTTAYKQVSVQASGGGCEAGGCWNLGDNGVDAGPVQPGDMVTVTSGNGDLPIIITVPKPFSATASSQTGQVAGQIDNLDHAVVEVQLDNQNQPKRVQTDANGRYTAVLADFPRGGQGEARYYTVVNSAEVSFHRRFQSPDLTFTVNYAHDWVETEYEPGHTVWITVTNSAGVVKATQTGFTGVVPWWCCSTGYSTNMGTWIPSQPDIVPGDFVYGALSNGYTTTVRIGTLNGTLNIAADTLVVTATVPWFSTVLNGRAWIDNSPGGTPGCDFLIAPNSGSHTCNFAPFDLTPLWSVSAQYQEPDGDWVRNVFQAPVARLNIQTWGTNQPGEGGNYAFNVRYENQGDAPAANTVLTSTLEGVTYLSDTSGFAAFGSGSVITWSLGTVPASSSNQFEIFVQVTAEANQNITNTVSIGTSSFDRMDGVNKEQQWWTTVQPNTADVTVDPGTWTWDPAPGYDYVYSPNVCNKGSTGSTEVTLTNTLPLSTTLVSWWGQNPGWAEVSRGTHELVVSRPTLPGGQCEQVYARVHLDPAAVPGDALYYQADVAATNDANLGNNSNSFTHYVGSPYYDLQLNKSWNWGELVPGGEVRYNLNYRNSGNLPIATTIRVTDTLPQNTTFSGAWYYDNQGQHPVTPTLVTAGYVVWDISTLENGFGNNYDVALRLNPAIAPGTVFTNCAAIGASVPEYNNPYDNRQCVADTVRAAGPNLRVTKTAEWQNGGNQIHYRVRLENIGTVAVNNVTVTDTYPAAFTLNGWDLNWGWSGVNDDGANHLLAVTLDSPLDPGRSADLNLYVGVPSVSDGTLFTNTAEITIPPGDVNPADNVATQVSGTGPDLSIEKWLTGGSATPRPGDLLTYTLHFANQSNGWGSNQITLTDTLPTGLTFVSAQRRLWCGPSGNFFCPWDPQDPASANLTWTWGGLNSNNWNDLLVTVQVTDTAQNGDSFVNTAEIGGEVVGSSGIDPFPLNNVSTHTVIVRKNWNVYLPLVRR